MSEEAVETTESSTESVESEGSSNWYDNQGFDEDTVGMIQTKGWDKVSDVVDSYRGLEKFHGVPKDQLLKLPKDGDAEGMGEVWNKLGRPESSDGYTMETPDGMQVNDDLYSKAKEMAFENGISSKAFTELMSLYNGSLQGGQQEYDIQLANNLQVQEQQLKHEWGPRHDESVFIADKAIRELGISSDDIEVMKIGMGHDGMYKMFNRIGALMGEKNVINSDSSTNDFAMTPEKARHEMKNIMKALEADPTRAAQYGAKGGADYVRYNQLKEFR